MEIFVSVFFLAAILFLGSMVLLVGKKQNSPA